VSLYTFDQKSNTLKLRGFDIGVKQSIYANSLTFNESLACLDYQGNFSLLEDLQGNVSPLLKYNKESVFSHSFNQLIRKFECLSDRNEILMMSLRGSLIGLKFATDSSLEKEHRLTLIHRKDKEEDYTEETDIDKEGIKYREVDRDLISYGLISAIEKIEFETQWNLKECV
jgi:hypothetical protein